MKDNTKTNGMRWAVIVLGVAVVILTIGVAVLALRPPTVVSTFDQCRKAGGALLESYPEQCSLAGATFVNPASQHAGGVMSPEEQVYVGLSEDEALAKAKQAQVPARVVERDGSSLPVTMDFVFGRHNFHVKDGKVMRVDIEGQGSDG